MGQGLHLAAAGAGWRTALERVLDDALAYFLDLRIRLRGRPEAVAIVDRCLLLLARVEGASSLEAELIADAVEALRAELLARFGPKASTRVH